MQGFFMGFWKIVQDGMNRAWIETEVAEDTERTEVFGILPSVFYFSVYLRLFRSLRFSGKPGMRKLA